MSEPAPQFFSRIELEQSMPFDGLRMLSTSRGDMLVKAVANMIKEKEERRRERRPQDAQRWTYGLNVLLANLALGLLNRVDPKRFVAISLNRNDYGAGELSFTAIRQSVIAMHALGLIEKQHGYRSVVNGTVRHARRTRIRASAMLRNLMSMHDIRRSDIGWSERRDILILREPDEGHLDQPEAVRASRDSLSRVNDALSSILLTLPDDAWDRVATRYRSGNEEDVERLSSGEEAMALYRVFKGDWGRGGRLYGGWWINLPKAERQHLLLKGEPVVERDYARLHPTLLFARRGVELNFDIYSVAGMNGPQVRDLGKRTFNRLINRSTNGKASLAETMLDREQLPEGVSFSDYVGAFVRQLSPIAEWFGTGEGIRLQREDSDLALAVLNSLLDCNVVALPVHDSFIVARQHEPLLIEAMSEQFRLRYGFRPAIR